MPRRLCSELLLEIPADVLDALVDSGDANALLLTVARARHLAGKPTLLATKLLLKAAKQTRILHSVAVAVGVELFQANIDADFICTTWRESYVFLDAQRNKVFAGGRTGNRSIRDFPIKRAGQTDADEPDLRELELSVDKTDAI